MTDVTSLGNTSAEITTNFMTLLVTELQHQNPLEPMDNQELAMQLATLSQLEQVEKQTRTFEEVLSVQNTSMAASLVGKNVSFIPSGMSEMRTGVVSSVNLSNGAAKLQVGEFTIDFEDIETINS